MTLFQILLLVVMAVLCGATFVAIRRGWATQREGLVLALVWLVAGLAIAWPDQTTRLAKIVGVGKGANLLLYCTVVTMMVGFLMVYARLRALRREMTLLVRHLALREATIAALPEAAPREEGDPT